MNGHEICSFILFEAVHANKQLQMENAALRQENERLKAGEPALKAAPKPKKKEADNGPVG